MFDSLEERVRRRKANAYAIQFTDGTPDEYEELIHDTYDEPLIEVDCATLDDYDSFFETIADDLVTDPNDYFSETSHVTDHFDREEGSLILYNFDEMDDETTRGLAMYLKGLAEQTPVQIALTADDTGAVFRGNSDLSGRVLTLNINEEYN